MYGYKLLMTKTTRTGYEMNSQLAPKSVMFQEATRVHNIL